MSINNSIEQLKQLSKQASKQMNLQMAILDETFNEMTVKLPESEAVQVNKLRGLSKEAMKLAKEGKVDEAQQIIKKFQNEYKNNK